MLKVFRINSASFVLKNSMPSNRLCPSYLYLIRQSKECAPQLLSFFHVVQIHYCSLINGCVSPVLGLMLAAMWKWPSAFAWWEMWRWTSWVPCWSGRTSVWVTRTEDLLCPFLIFFKWWIVCCGYKKEINKYQNHCKVKSYTYIKPIASFHQRNED